MVDKVKDGGPYVAVMRRAFGPATIRKDLPIGRSHIHTYNCTTTPSLEVRCWKLSSHNLLHLTSCILTLVNKHFFCVHVIFFSKSKDNDFTYFKLLPLVLCPVSECAQIVDESFKKC